MLSSSPDDYTLADGRALCSMLRVWATRQQIVVFIQIWRSLASLGCTYCRDTTFVIGTQSCNSAFDQSETGQSLTAPLLHSGSLVSPELLSEFMRLRGVSPLTSNGAPAVYVSHVRQGTLSFCPCVAPTRERVAHCGVDVSAGTGGSVPRSLTVSGQDGGRVRCHEASGTCVHPLLPLTSPYSLMKTCCALLSMVRYSLEQRAQLRHCVVHRARGLSSGSPDRRYSLPHALSVRHDPLGTECAQAEPLGRVFPSGR
jgi:hypothetical protein